MPETQHPNRRKSDIKADVVTGLHGLPATITKLGMAGCVLLMLMWKFMINDPEERREARKHGEHAVNRLSEAIDRQTQTFIDVQSETHRNQKLLIDAQNKKTK